MGFAGGVADTEEAIAGAAEADAGPERTAGEPRPVALVGMMHGFLYMAYIVCTLILAERCRWRPLDAVVILLAGTIPIASFVAERQVTRRVREGRAVLGSG